MPSETIEAIRRRLGVREGGPVRERGGADWIGWFVPGDWAPGAEEALPIALDGWTGSGTLRLDDRASLAARLRDRARPGGEDDAHLAWRSFSAWGEAAPTQWLGDYALAAIAPARDRIVLTRGTLGVVHCFHASIGAVVIVASDPDTIASVPGAVTSVEERAVAEFLGTGALLTPTITFRAGIERLPAAHTLVIQRDGTRRLLRHWALPVPEERREAPSGEVIEEFNEVLGRAVADRLRGPRASLLLSGGLDSPALALAARRNAPAVSLTAITHSWRALLPADDEGEWAALAANAAGLAHRVTEMAPDCGFGDAGAYRTPEPSIDPEPGVWRGAAAGLASVAPVSLLGEDVDTLLFPTTLLDQLRSSGLLRTWQRWRAFRTETGARPWVGLRRSSGAIERWRDTRARRAPAWVDRSLLARHPLPEVLPGRPHPTRALAARALSQPIWENSLWDESPAMSGAAVQVLLPYMDPRVITFLFSLPSVPWAQRKHLMRSVLRGAMPDALVARPKTPMTGYYEARVREWRRFGATADLRSPMGSWVDLRKFKAILATGTADEVFAAWRVIELARWLAQPPVGVR